MSKKNKKQNYIDPKFLLTFQSFFLVDWFGFYFEAISPWDHAIALYDFNFSVCVDSRIFNTIHFLIPHISKSHDEIRINEKKNYFTDRYRILPLLALQALPIVI